MSLINREELIAAYDREHKGPPGGARKLMVKAKAAMPDTGRWRKIPAGCTPGGAPCYVCDRCGGSEHLYDGVEFRKRHLYCHDCGCVNAYPGEEVYEEVGA